MTGQPDADLVARVQTGDEAAFEALMRRHFRMAFLIAFAQLNDRSEAEDVCQDAFFRCWERIDECRNPARVSAWIAAIVRNAAHNRREYLGLRVAESLAIDGAGARVAAPQRTDTEAELSDLRSRLLQALDTLSPVQREIVLLHDLDGWKHAEVAARLDLSETMSRRHLSDARKRLRALLRDLSTLEPDHD